MQDDQPDGHRSAQLDAPPSPAQAKPGRSGTVQSVEVALQILDAIAENEGLARVNSLARQLDMTKAKVSRHLQTLLRLGLVAKGAQDEGYTFGWKLLRLGRAATRSRNIGELSRRHMQRLRDETGQTVILSVPVPHGVVVLQCVESLQTTSVTVRTAAFLGLPRSPAARLSARLAPAVRDPSPLPEGSELKHWPQFGAEYEVDTGNGVGGVSAPILDDTQALLAVVSIVAPSSVLRPRPPEAMVRALERCARAIEFDYVQGTIGGLDRG